MPGRDGPTLKKTGRQTPDWLRALAQDKEGRRRSHHAEPMLSSKANKAVGQWYITGIGKRNAAMAV